MDDTLLLLASMAGATLRIAVPLILCSLAGLYSERSGLIDIGLEAKLLSSAFAAAVVGHYTGSPWLALMAGMSVGALLALVHGFACITHRGDQVVSGMALNILAGGLTAVLGVALFAQGGRTPEVAESARFTALMPGVADAVQGWPGVGPLLAELFFKHNVLVFVAFLLIPFTHWVMYHTRFGLRLRATGENPAMVDSAGISVTRIRYTAALICGALCGVGGTYLALAQAAAFTPGMSAGLGYISLAAMIFGQWRPFPALSACLLFAFLDASAVRLQGISLPWIGDIPVQWIQMLPYVLTVVLLAGFFGKAQAPKALGRAYVKER